MPMAAPAAARRELAVRLRELLAFGHCQWRWLTPRRGHVLHDVLRDLLYYHRLDGDDAFRALLPEIERLANAKSEAGRFEEDGALVLEFRRVIMVKRED